jgi:hypothetical protein
MGGFYPRPSTAMGKWVLEIATLEMNGHETNNYAFGRPVNKGKEKKAVCCAGSRLLFIKKRQATINP